MINLFKKNLLFLVNILFYGCVFGIPFCSFLQRHLLNQSSIISLTYRGGFNNSASPVMEGIFDFHNDVFIFLIIISSLVGWLLIRIIFIYRNFSSITKIPTFVVKPKHIILFNSNFSNLVIIRKHTYNQLLEIIWTIIPSFILILIAYPSFSLLYCINELLTSELTIKIIGNQWYWHYEYSDNTLTERTINSLLN
jgi:heme/copper-type cytochrome/quinol oxidase subunit 2